MLRSGVTARRIGDARARDDSPATGDRRPRAPRTAHLPAVFSRATKLNQVLQVYTQVRQEETPDAHNPPGAAIYAPRRAEFLDAP